MNHFEQRSTASELIDEPGIPFSDWETCLEELDVINTWLGGHAITVEGVNHLHRNKKQPITIAETGCGGGDNLKAIYRKFRNADLRFIGIDLNQACINYAVRNCKEIPGATFICSDYRKVDFGTSKPDIIFNSLFCHHFSNDDLVDMMRWMKDNSRLGFFINDLHRHPLACTSIRLLTRLFSKSYLVKNDAPISVMRGFVKNDWQGIMDAAGLKNYSIGWRWAFRHLVLYSHE